MAVQWDDAAHYSFEHTLRVDAFGRGAGLIVFSAGLLATLVGVGHAVDARRARSSTTRCC